MILIFFWLLTSGMVFFKFDFSSDLTFVSFRFAILIRDSVDRLGTLNHEYLLGGLMVPCMSRERVEHRGSNSPVYLC